MKMSRCARAEEEAFQRSSEKSPGNSTEKTANGSEVLLPAPAEKTKALSSFPPFAKERALQRSRQRENTVSKKALARKRSQTVPTYGEATREACNPSKILKWNPRNFSRRQTAPRERPTKARAKRSSHPA